MCTDAIMWRELCVLPWIVLCSGCAGESLPPRTSTVISAADSLAWKQKVVSFLEEQSRPQLTLVLIGASWCGASTAKGFPDSLEVLKASLAGRAQARGLAFGTLGIAMDRNRQEGLRFLDKMGRFDQYVLGGNWLNEGLVRFVWRDSPGQPEVPQVVLVLRTRQFSMAGISLGQDSIVGRYTGTEDIMSLPGVMASGGGPLAPDTVQHSREKRGNGADEN